jgi:rhodanese-related sulfurtransferase
MRHSEGFLSLVNDSRGRVLELSVEAAKARMESGEAVRLIDVREDNEWDAGHIVGAEHMGRGIIERDIEETIPDKSVEIILYCGGGYRSILVADNLQRMGYTNVFSMAGGWRGWNEAEYPTTQGEGP